MDNTNIKTKKQRILWWSDTPVLELGYSQVAKQILKSLHLTGEYEITVVGINHHVVTYYDRDEYPYEIHSPINSQDVYNTKVFETLLMQGDYDILFTLQNFNYIAQFTPLITELRNKLGFKWIMYSPIDTDNAIISDLIPFTLADYAVSYTEFGLKVLKKYFPQNKLDKVSVIGHGCEPDLFYKLPDSERKELRIKVYGITDDQFVIGCVNRNQWRKDLPRMGVAIKELRKSIPEAILLLHCKPVDIGGDLRKIFKCLDLVEGEDFILSDMQSEAFGVERSDMNKIYNCMDVVSSTTVGEGWGLAITEAFAAGIPVVYPNHSSITEIIGKNEERGYLVETEKYPYFPVTDSIYHYYLTDVDSLVEKWKIVYNHSKTNNINLMCSDARFYAEDNSWEKINQKWIDIFKKSQRQ